MGYDEFEMKSNEKFIVQGGNSLQGEITPSGNKTEALPVLAAVLLTEEPVILHNVPDIADIRSMMDLLESLGVIIEEIGPHSLRFESRQLTHCDPDTAAAREIRGSFLLAGPMLARYGCIRLPAPGGDRIGMRPVQTHLLALRQLGVKIELDSEGQYVMQTDRLRGISIYLDEASVMATENAIMAAVMAWGRTTIYNAACEPHVQGLCRCLLKMGAHITGIGSNLLTIDGCVRLHGAEYTIQPDHTEVGSFIGLAAVTGSQLKIRNAGVDQLKMIRMMFERLGVATDSEGDDLMIPAEQSLRINQESPGIPKIDDAPWPGFPADLTSIMTVVATQCKGTVLIFEKMFESRLFWVDKLISMGAQILLCDPHRAVVSGPSKLQGMPVSSPDIRAGMALLIAALCAKGESIIQNVHQIDRGYERVDERLRRLGADIQRVDY